MSGKPKDSIERGLVAQFKRDVCVRAESVDPDERLDWFALSIGYFMGRGVDPDIAWRLGTYVRYELQYWPREEVNK